MCLPGSTSPHYWSGFSAKRKAFRSTRTSVQIHGPMPWKPRQTSVHIHRRLQPVLAFLANGCDMVPTLLPLSCRSFSRNTNSTSAPMNEQIRSPVCKSGGPSPMWPFFVPKTLRPWQTTFIELKYSAALDSPDEGGS